MRKFWNKFTRHSVKRGHHDSGTTISMYTEVSKASPDERVPRMTFEFDMKDVKDKENMNYNQTNNNQEHNNIRKNNSASGMQNFLWRKSASVKENKGIIKASKSVKKSPGRMRNRFRTRSKGSAGNLGFDVNLQKMDLLSFNDTEHISANKDVRNREASKTEDEENFLKKLNKRRTKKMTAKQGLKHQPEVEIMSIDRKKAMAVLARLLETQHQNNDEPPQLIMRSASQQYQLDDFGHGNHGPLSRSLKRPGPSPNQTPSLQKNASFSSVQSLEASTEKPSIVDEIRIIRRLGSGTFGEVFKAENVKTGEFIAVKKMIGNSFQEQAKFLKEAQILQMSNHPNVLRFVGLFIRHDKPLSDANAGYSPSNRPSQMVSDVSEDPAMVDLDSLEPSMSIYLCTEYCQYGDLTKMLRNQKIEILPWTVRMRLGLDIARGLKYLHSKKIVHRDIKGENVLLKPVRKFDAVNLEKSIEKSSTRYKRRQIIQKTQKRPKRGIKLGDEDKNLEMGKVGQANNGLKARGGIKDMVKRNLTVPLRKSKPRRRRGPPKPRNLSADSGDSDESEEEEPHTVPLTPLGPPVPLRPERQRTPLPSGLGTDDVPIHHSQGESLQDSEYEPIETASQLENPDDVSIDSSVIDSDDQGYVRDEVKYVENLLNCRAILADVGLARVFKTRFIGKPTSSVHQAQNNERMTIRGTPWTMAPELFTSRTGYTTASDVFSLGVVFLEISTRSMAQDLPRQDDFSIDFDELNKWPADPFQLEPSAIVTSNSEPVTGEPRSHSAIGAMVAVDEDSGSSDDIRKPSFMVGTAPVPPGFVRRASTDFDANAARKPSVKMSFSESCPADFKALAMRCCALDPVKRPSAQEIVNELERIVLRDRRMNRPFNSSNMRLI